MFEAIAIAAAVSLLFGIVVDDELFRLCNTVANFATVALIVWHQRHVRRHIEPKLDDTAAVVKRQLGERHGTPPSEHDEWDGTERRKDS